MTYISIPRTLDGVKTPTKPKQAISYLRFSSSAQGKIGKDSITRQENAIKAALAKHGLELDREFHDRGKSGFHKRHIAPGGALHELRRMAVNGLLKGKILVIEDWDRAGRLQATDAAPLLMDMLNNDVDLVVGSHGGDYFSKETVNANPFLLYRALDEMNRGFGESKRKSDMAKSKWQSRRDAVAKGEYKALNSLPWWLENGKTDATPGPAQYLIKKGMKKLIKRIFDLYLSGRGCQVIANMLDAEKLPLPPNKNGSVRKNANGWHSSYVQNLIKNRALIGYYFKTEHKIFPAVIDEATFYKANQKRKERIRFSGRRAEHINPYAGLTFCKCGGHIGRHTSRTTSKTSYVYLQCSNSRRAKCSAAGIPYELFEESFSVIWENKEIVAAALGTGSDASSQLKELQGKLGAIASKLAQVQSDYANTPSSSLAAIMAKMEAQEAALKKQLENATIAERGTTTAIDAYRDFIGLVLEYGSEPETRLKVQECLRNMLERITIDIAGRSYTIEFKGGKKTINVTELDAYGCKVNGVQYRLIRGVLKYEQGIPDRLHKDILKQDLTTI